MTLKKVKRCLASWCQNSLMGPESELWFCLGSFFNAFCQISVQFLEAPKLLLIKVVYRCVPAPCGGNGPHHLACSAFQFGFIFICSLFYCCFFRRTIPFLLPSFAVFCPYRPSFSSHSFLFLPSLYLVCSPHLPASSAGR